MAGANQSEALTGHHYNGMLPAQASATVLSIMTFSIMALSITTKNATLSKAI
jgi:hypothetical protein